LINIIWLGNRIAAFQLHLQVARGTLVDVVVVVIQSSGKCALVVDVEKASRSDACNELDAAH
jgi:hypothetical protein